ncbi:MAG: hypothetical protein CMJ78_26365 [Planctomycetaceae bacterium]|nr:hypothetical protein [Planctomycetaceae bacterium]
MAHVVGADEIQFNRDVRPILAANCFTCHGPDSGQRQAGLRLDRREDAIARLESGTAAIVPGNANSELLKRISANDADEKMPPEDSGKSLTNSEVRILRQWIREGAKWQDHWSMIAPVRPDVPKVQDIDWPMNAIDNFILARLEEHEISLAAETDMRTLARRVSTDLLGLPPTYKDVRKLAETSHPDRYEQYVDRLLQSPHFGERMAIYWLDLVRYADSVGYHGDQERLVAPYRDYVIGAFNQNMRFDQFTVEQLAGDLLPDANLWQRVASGYNMLNMTTIEGGAQAGEYLAKYAADRVRNVSGVWMGATLGCAECHDHKYDAYTQRDFYSFASFFADLKEKGVGNAPSDLPVPSIVHSAEIELIDEELFRIAELRKREDTKQLASREKDLKTRRASLMSSPRKTVQTVAVKPRMMRVLNRGDWLDASGEIVKPATPGALPKLQFEGDRATRFDLARWLVSGEHPQTARVFVNRLWKLYFGSGISGVLDDLGVQGEWPVHPELLDWLAVEFVESGWDVKHIIRLMVTSRTYRLSSIPLQEHYEVDRKNRLHARQSRWRMDAEMIRDSALSLGNLLVNEIGGDSVRPYQPAGYYAHLNFPTRVYKHHTDRRQFRRGVYVHWQRTYLHPSMLAFDAPNREECTAERSVSNTPQAALVLLNDPTHIEAARKYAVRILVEGGESFEQRVDWAWKTALQRTPDAREVELLRTLHSHHLDHFKKNPTAATAFVRVGQSTSPQDITAVELAAWTSVCRSILNLHELITRD